MSWTLYAVAWAVIGAVHGIYRLKTDAKIPIPELESFWLDAIYFLLLVIIGPIGVAVTIWEIVTGY
jgi:hypothetical protein